MATEQKFLFDRDFDDVQGRIAEEVLASDELAEEEIVEPTFSEADLTPAREQGYQSGRQEALAETQDSIESQLLDTFSAIDAQLNSLFSRQRDNNEAAAKEAIEMVMMIAGKMLPELNNRHGLDEVARVVEQLFERLLLEPRVTVRVHDSLVEPLDSRLRNFLSNRGYDGDLAIRAETDLKIGDCRVEWSSGAAERSVEELWAEIEAVIADNLAAQSTAPSAPPEPEESEFDGDGIQSEVIESQPQDDVETATVIDEIPAVPADSRRSRCTDAGSPPARHRLSCRIPGNHRR